MGNYEKSDTLFYWFSITSVTNYHKLNVFKQPKLNISQIYRSEVLVGSAGSSALSLTRQESICWPSWALMWKSWGWDRQSSASRLIYTFGTNQFHVALSPPFSAGCQPDVIPSF